MLGLILLSACETTYQEGNFAGGVKALPITSDTYRISASGNGYTSSSTIQDYVLLKAAETTLQANQTHFVIIGSQDTSRQETGQTATTANMIGNTMFINPGVTYGIYKPGQDTMIKIFAVAAGQRPPAQAFNAQEVYNSISPRVKRPSKP